MKKISNTDMAEGIQYAQAFKRNHVKVTITQFSEEIGVKNTKTISKLYIPDIDEQTLETMLDDVATMCDTLGVCVRPFHMKPRFVRI